MEGLSYATELVALIREYFPDFGIGVGGYPEKHPEAPDKLTDLHHLKEKVDAGADFITTQLFFENQAYFSFLQECKDTGNYCSCTSRSPSCPIPWANSAVLQNVRCIPAGKISL